MDFFGRYLDLNNVFIRIKKLYSKEFFLIIN